jgi:hypothetical protein
MAEQLQKSQVSFSIGKGKVNHLQACRCANSISANSCHTNSIKAHAICADAITGNSLCSHAVGANSISANAFRNNSITAPQLLLFLLLKIKYSIARSIENEVSPFC